MENPALIQLSNDLFRFGPRSLGLQDLFTTTTLEHVQKKFKSKSGLELFIALRELSRCLYMAAHSPDGAFFPGDQFLDDVWHALILETAEYRVFCSKLRPACFVEHTGIIFENYCKTRTAEEIHTEQFSWLASYVHNFGDLEKESVSYLPLTKSLMQRLELSLESLNHLGRSILQAATQGNNTQSGKFGFENFLSEVVQPQANLLDVSAGLLSSTILELVHGVASIRECGINSPLLLSNSELESAFGASSALAFTLWQHFASIERLARSLSWQEQNTGVWRELSQGQRLCGLATTHLARAGSPVLSGKQNEQGFTLSGVAPWVTGFGIFNSLVVGFESGCGSETEIVYALIDYPTEESLKPDSKVKVTRHALACMNSTSTVKIEFVDYSISSSQVIERRRKGEKNGLKPSVYSMPDLGIAKSALAECEKLIAKQVGNPKSALIANGVQEISNRIRKLVDKTIESADELSFKKDEVIRDSVRLLAIASGGEGLVEGSLLSRLQRELLLLDSIIQSPVVIEMKIKRVSHG